MALNFGNLHNKQQFKKRIAKNVEELIPFEHVFKINFSNLEYFSVNNNLSCLIEGNYNLNSLCFFDTETTGLSGGAGTVIFLAGIGYFDNSQLIVKQFFIDSPAKEVMLIESLRKIMNERQVIVSYNGKCFDVPLLHSRAVMNKVEKIKVQTQIDLLHISRFIWKNSLSDCKLTTIERQILRIKRTDDDIAGHLIPAAYRDFLIRGEVKLIKKIIYHNREDIVSLARLYLYLYDKSMKLNNLSVSIAIAKKMFGNNEFESCLAILRKSLDNSVQVPLDIKKEIFWIASMCLKKQKKYTEASKLWEKLKTSEAYLELAKYYEHKERNFKKAVEITKLLLAKNNKNKNSDKLNHRLNRLNKKLNINKC
jgi:uncharacterized protein YprB with RNaseH-like and TPR domain